MNSVSTAMGQSFADHPKRKAFLKWQCLARQIMMRDNQGRPDDAVMPAVVVPDQDEPIGHIITILNKAPANSMVPEMSHMLKKTNDPAQIRDAALQFLSATYYQKHAGFSDILTSTFPPDSPGAARLIKTEFCHLVFSAYGQTWDLECKIWELGRHNSLFEATLAHNRLFNPTLPDETVVLGFEPDWENSTSS